jgi:hypothetical protein
MKKEALAAVLAAFFTNHLPAQNDPTAVPTPAGAPRHVGGLSVGPGTKAAQGTEMEQGMAVAAQLLQALQGKATNNPLSALGGRTPVDFRELKAFLPDKLDGLRRTNARGQKSGLMGADITVAEGEYGEPGGAHLQVKITDLAAMGALGTFAGLGWMATEIDSEGDAGYERTTDYQGRKGLEKYAQAARSGTATVVVRNRFLVEIEGRGIEAPQLKNAVDGMDLNALEKLASPPATP